jgi:hypothetical protein
MRKKTREKIDTVEDDDKIDVEPVSRTSADMLEELILETRMTNTYLLDIAESLKKIKERF